MDWSIYTLATGLLTGTRFSGPDDMTFDVPDGCAAIQGAFDHLSYKVDLETGEVVDWQPDAPPDTDDATYSWDATIRRWVGMPTLNAIKRLQWQTIKANAHLTDQTDITIAGYTLKADDATRAALFQKAQIALLNQVDTVPFTINWQLADDTPVTLTGPQLKAIVRAVDARADDIRAKAATLRTAIIAATTPADVMAIVWSWP